MKLFRIILAVFMLAAVVLKSLPDSVFDYFHHHEHSTSENSDYSTVADYTYNCHIQDWVYTEYAFNHPVNDIRIDGHTLVINSAIISLGSITQITTQGRGPPIA